MSAPRSNDAAMIDNLHYVKDLGCAARRPWKRATWSGFGELMHEHWEHKTQALGRHVESADRRWYDLAMDNGALGGKLIGAGGGGFLMFYAEDKVPLRHAMREAGLRGALSFRLRRHQGRTLNSDAAGRDSRGRRSPRDCARITATVPKALVEVAGQPFIVHQLHLAAIAKAFERVVLCVGISAR